MLKKTSLLIPFLLSLSTIAGAASSEKPAISSLTNLAAPVILPRSAVPQKAAVKEWTIMAYLNGKNNLEKYALKNVNQMEVAGSSDKINIVVELGRKSGVNRYYIQKDASTTTISSPLAAAPSALGNPDMGSSQHLVDFGKWAMANYPAKHYMLIVWDHGTGWIDKTGELDIEKGISYDDVTKNHISTQQLGQALKDIGKIDIYASDACLMQMAEVTHEIYTSMDYIIGSEQTVPGDGYPYDTWLTPLVANPAMSVEEVGKTLLSAYGAYYDKQRLGASLSMLRTSAIPRLAILTDDWAGAARTAAETAVIKNAKDSAQRYTNADNKDLFGFVKFASEGSKNAVVTEKGKILNNFIETELVVAVGRGGGVGMETRGIAIYIPEGSFFNNAYDQLAWAKATRWGSFARWVQTIR